MDELRRKIDRVKNVWQEGNSPLTKINDDLEKYRIHQLMGFVFSPGPYYFYTFDFSTMSFDFVSPELQSVLGYKEEEFTINNWLSWLHPEDSAFIAVKEQMAVDFLFKKIPAEKIPKYKVSYDFLIRKKDGSYCRILHQAIALGVDEAGKIPKVLGVHSDITHLKKVTDHSISFIGMEGEPSYYSIKPDKKILKKYDLDFSLTDREVEILSFAAAGLTSKQIASELNISQFTVSTHRKKMLSKTKHTSMVTLIIEALNRGII